MNPDPTPASDPVIDHHPGDARCNFCDGPMPCFCPEPEGWQNMMDEDARLRSKYDTRLDYDP